MTKKKASKFSDAPSFSLEFFPAQDELQSSIRHAELVLASRGRSMIEMLGVLAIIGVLSIGALVGVKFAFDSVKANNLLNDVRLYAATITHNDYDLDTQEFNPSTEFAFWAEWIEERNVVFAVNAEEVPKGVCNSAKNKAKNEYIVQINGTENGNCNDENNQMKFIMNGQDICSENCANICCDGVCCPSNEHTCVAGKCHKEASCPSGVCGENCYDPNFESCCSGTICESGNVCVGVNKNECCAFGHATSNYKLCCDFEQTPCDDECCPVGTVCTNGVCRTAECYTKGSTTEKCTGSNCDCYIGENRCGTGCTADGLTCSAGHCINPPCPDGTKYAYNPGTKYYGCLTENAPSGLTYHCVKLSNSYDPVYCHILGTNTPCSMGSNLNSLGNNYGNCYYNPCADDWTFTSVKGTFNVYGCQKNDGENIYKCYGSDSNTTKFSCSVNDVLCATGCDNKMQGCSENSDSCTGCPEGATWDNGYCVRNDGKVKSKFVTGVGIQAWKLDNNSWLPCGYYCTNLVDGICNGVCEEDVCPEGTSWGRCSSQFGGCKADGIDDLCCTQDRRNGDSGTIFCYSSYNHWCGAGCSDFFASGENCTACLNLDCGDGTLSMDNWGTLACRYSNGLICAIDGNCYMNDIQCAGGCNIDGTNCTSGKCICEGEETLQYYTGADGKQYFGCHATITDNFSCSEDGSGTYSCQFGTKPCGTGCAEDGSNCSTGVCVAEECTDDTALSLVTNAYYGCYSATNGTKCYRYGNAYVCYKNSVECGTGCNIDGTDCNVGQTCVTEDE